ncbi:MAG: pyridoxamine 5'-phosphate oxidase family protein [Caldimonas sp.]
MEPDSLYHAGARQLQDRFDTRRLADRIAERLGRRTLNDDDQAFIAAQALFLLASADARGRPECSYKGGRPGFVGILDASHLLFPSYDGNGMFRSLGNLLVNPQVGLLFIDFASGRRLRVQGRATIDLDDPLRGDFDGAQCVVRVAVDEVFPNCPRYVHPMQRSSVSEFAPRPGHVPPVPAWKRFEMFRDVLAADDPAREG